MFEIELSVGAPGDTFSPRIFGSNPISLSLCSLFLAKRKKKTHTSYVYPAKEIKK
jgi:hypothetical protein